MALVGLFDQTHIGGQYLTIMTNRRYHFNKRRAMSPFAKLLNLALVLFVKYGYLVHVPLCTCFLCFQLGNYQCHLCDLAIQLESIALLFGCS